MTLSHPAYHVLSFVVLSCVVFCCVLSLVVFVIFCLPFLYVLFYRVLSFVVFLYFLFIHWKKSRSPRHFFFFNAFCLSFRLFCLSALPLGRRHVYWYMCSFWSQPILLLPPGSRTIVADHSRNRLRPVSSSCFWHKYYCMCTICRGICPFLTRHANALCVRGRWYSYSPTLTLICMP